MYFRHKNLTRPLSKIGLTSRSYFGPSRWKIMVTSMSVMVLYFLRLCRTLISLSTLHYSLFAVSTISAISSQAVQSLLLKGSMSMPTRPLSSNLDRSDWWSLHPSWPAQPTTSRRIFFKIIFKSCGASEDFPSILTLSGNRGCSL